MDDTKNKDEVSPVENDNNEGKIKTTAVDTGRRVDVTARSSKPMLRRRHIRDPRETPPTAKPAYSPQPEIAREMPEERPVIKEEAPIAKQPMNTERRIPLYVEPLEIDETGDFLSLLNESEDLSSQQALNVGDKVTGKIVHIGKEHIFLSLGPKIEAAMDLIEVSDADGKLSVRLGQKITAFVISTHGGVTLSNNVADGSLDASMLENARANKLPVEGKVTGVNKGGFDVQIAGKRAFCPVGQIDNRFVEDTNSFVGRTLNFLIEKIEEGGRNIVVSRRALLERERRSKAIELVKGIELNKKYDAVITRVADFGAFADIGGLEGLIPRSEIAHGHIDRVSDAVSTGDRVEVMILSFDINTDDPLKSKLSFSLKKTKEDPYTLHWSKIAPGSTLEGRVVRLESFGAFVELFPGIDGLIHISELSENRVAHPKEVLNVGDPVTVRVVTVDEQEKRIGLSLRESVTRHKSDDVRTQVKVERGQKFSGVVSRIERYGVFLELDNGVTALLPQSETGLPRHSDLSRAFSIGTRLDVLVIDVDTQNRVRVSTTARKEIEERDSYLQFQNKENQRGASFGTFADLLKKK